MTQTPRDRSVWEHRGRQVEVLRANGDTVTYRVIREGNYRRTTDMDTAKFLARFTEVRPHPETRP